MIEFSLPEDVAALEAELRRFARDELRPRLRDAEAAGSWDADVRKAVEGFGLGALDAPESWGGLGVGALGKVVALEALAWGDAGGVPGADPSGPAVAAILAAEAGAFRPLAESALAGQASLGLTFDPSGCQWSPGSPSRYLVAGADALVAYDNPPAEPADVAAFHASGGVRVALADATTVARAELTPETALAVRGRARLWPAAVAVGLGQAAFDYARDYAVDRVVMGRPVAHHQGNAFAIAEVAAELDAARWSARVAAARFDDGQPWAGFWATLAWLDAMDAAARATDLGVQLLGGHGYVEDHPSEKWFREARMLACLWGGRDGAVDDAARVAPDVPDPELP